MARLAMRVKADRDPKFSVRKVNRCKTCGRGRGFLRKFSMCRICFRAGASRGLLPGVTKASW